MSVTAETFVPPDDALIRLATPRPVKFTVNDGVLEFKFNKKLWRFASEAAPIFRRLEERRVCSVAELCAAAGDGINHEKVRALVGELLFHGLATIASANYRRWD